MCFGADIKKQRTQDTVKIINYIYDNLEYVNISSYIEESFEEYKKYYEQNVYLYKTTVTPDITLEVLENYEFPLKSNSSNLLNVKFYTIDKISSKLNPNDKIGCMIVYYEDKILCSMDIYLENEIKQNSCTYYFVKIFKEFNVYISS